VAPAATAEPLVSKERAEVADAPVVRRVAPKEAAPEEPAKKGKPITKAMAQAAAKILTADELIASAPPPRKPAPRAAAPQQRAPQKRPAASGKGSSNHPFDSRL
jgi:hypothetical protein